MMTPTDTNAREEAAQIPFSRVFVAIAGIYVAQSLVSGLTFQSFPAILRSSGAPLDQIGLVSLALLPWALKFLWAPAVERYRMGGHRRRSRQIVIAGEIVVAAALLAAAAARIGAAGVREHPERDLPGMIRGVRLVFLAVAAFAAAAGWLMAHPLPLVVAVVIAAIDVIETSFLLLVVTVRGERDPD